ncbi:MAG TPA: hypothetical protein VGH95_07935 [Candidatus Aquirickettsiella sp.]
MVEHSIGAWPQPILRGIESWLRTAYPDRSIEANYPPFIMGLYAPTQSIPT